MTTSNIPEKLPTRSEVPVELTWDLSPVYADESQWDADFKRIEELAAPFTTLRDTLHEAPSRLLRCLQNRDEVGQLYGKLRAYASLRKSEDNGDTAAQARADRARMLGTKLSTALAWIEPELLTIPAQTIRNFIAEEPELKLYEYYFETLEHRRPHVRNAEVEDVLAQVSEPLGAPANTFTLFNNADLKFPHIKDAEGNEIELTHGRYSMFLESRDRRVREEAFRTMHGEYFKWRNTLAGLLSGEVKSGVASARLRQYGSSLEAALSPDDIPTDVYRNLLSTVRERLPVLHRYLRLRKKLLKLPDLQMWDLYVPMVADVDRPITYEESQRAVLESSAPLGPEYSATVQHAFENRWVDVPENEGKTSGAYSDGSYLTPPYILMNWQDKLDKTFTLAHEMGHSLHSHLTRSTQPYVYGDYTIFVAEVASTLSEALLTHYLLQQARAENDKSMQLYLLNYQAERFRTTLYRQTMFAEFELAIYTSVENGEPLTAEGMSEKYLQLNRDYYGAEVNVDEVVAIEWARIPHFYYNFYVYQYATGIAAAAALSKQILEEGEPAVERFLNFLRGGSSQTSIDLLKGAGVDMTTPEPINQALDVFNDIIAQMEELAGEPK